MKFLFFIFFSIAVTAVFAQQTEFVLQGQVVDARKNPVPDAYIFVTRTAAKSVSLANGTFEIRVLPSDSIIISHIAFLRKEIHVYQLLVNPVIQLEIDTVNIKPINVSADQRTSYEKAMENIDRIEFDFRPNTTDIMTEKEQMNELMKSQDEIQRAQASSISLLRFSPSEQFAKLKEKRQKKKEAQKFNSSKEVEETEKQ